jgi:hypothetical protein
MALLEPEYDLRQEEEHVARPISNQFEDDPKIRLLGKSFTEITKLLGAPDDKGYSEMFGPHQYILYRHDEGFIRFCSPESQENEIAISIILGPGQEVLGAKVGMQFSEIIDILGTADYGPDIGIDDLYYLDYYYGEINNQIPDIFVSFVAASLNSPTEYTFIKMENLKFEELLFQAVSGTER